MRQKQAALIDKKLFWEYNGQSRLKDGYLTKLLASQNAREKGVSMLKTVATDTPEVTEHLKKEFGDFQKCCDVVMPPNGSLIEISEPLQTAHESSGIGLDENNCIPPGIYESGFMLGGCTSHTVKMKIISSPQRIIPHMDEIFLFVGYRGDRNVDWRGAKLHVPKS